MNAVASAERWVVLGPSAFDGLDVAGEQGTFDARVEAASVTDAELTGPLTMTTLAIHVSFVPDIREALEDGATVWLALSSSSLEREQVAYPLARFPDGTHRFPGDECLAPGLRDILEETFDERLEALVGVTGHRRIEQLLQQQQP